MVRKTAVSLVLVFVLLLPAIVVTADETDWVVRVRATDTEMLRSQGDLTVGWMNGFTDGYDADGHEYIDFPPILPGSALCVAAAEVKNTDGSLVGLSLRDYRSNWVTTPSLANDRLSWSIRIYSVASGVPLISPVRVTVWQSSLYPFPWESMPAGTRIVFSGAYNGVFDSSTWTDSTSFSFDVENVSESNPAMLYMTVKVVPEPSSVFGLSSALLALAGTTVLRRRIR